jgi:hypothetical protein
VQVLYDLRLEHKMEMWRLQPDEAAEEGQRLEAAVLRNENVVDGEEKLLSDQHLS